VDSTAKKGQLSKNNRRKGTIPCGLFRKKGTITPRQTNNGEASSPLKTFLNKNTFLKTGGTKKITRS
jgi:hypothetical protein